MKRVLVIDSLVPQLSASQMQELRDASGASEEEVIVVHTPDQAYAMATKYQSTIQLAILVASWSASLVNKLHDCLRRTRARIIAVCTNKHWLPQVRSFCHCAVDSVDKVTEAIVHTISPTPAAAAKSTA